VDDGAVGGGPCGGGGGGRDWVGVWGVWVLGVSRVGFSLAYRKHIKLLLRVTDSNIKLN
jgi:hypothetical protein